MSAAKRLKLEVDNITECSICMEIMHVPKVLPNCHNTFCLSCLEEHGKKNRVGRDLRCPMCRGMFRVPLGGLSKLQNNFTIEKLIEARADSDEETSNRCLRHAKKLKFYCEECKVAVCFSCFIADHNQHRCSDFEVVKNEFRKHLAKNCGEVKGMVIKIDGQLNRLNDIIQSVESQVEDSQKKLIERGESLKRQVDELLEKELENLNSKKSKVVGTFKQNKKFLRKRKMEMEEFINYYQNSAGEDEVPKDVDGVVRKMETEVSMLRSKSAIWIVPAIVSFTPSKKKIFANLKSEDVIGRSMTVFDRTFGLLGYDYFSYKSTEGSQ